MAKVFKSIDEIKQYYFPKSYKREQKQKEFEKKYGKLSVYIGRGIRFIIR